jgi:hypothetical protein
MAIWNVLRTFGIFYEHFYIFVHLVHFSSLGIMSKEKSGNPVTKPILDDIRHEASKFKFEALKW